MSRAALIALACIAASPAMLRSQDTTLVAPGDPVRVTAPTAGLKRWTGYFAGFRGDSILLYATPADTSRRVVPVDAVERFEVDRGNHPEERQVLKGMAIGATMGLVWGVAASALYSCGHDSYWLCDPHHTIPTFTLVGAGVGGLMGAFWKERPYAIVPLASVRSSAALEMLLPGGAVALTPDARMSVTVGRRVIGARFSIAF
jgi:hypothetical protein